MGTCHHLEYIMLEVICMKKNILKFKREISQNASRIWFIRRRDNKLYTKQSFDFLKVLQVLVNSLMCNCPKTNMRNGVRISNSLI